MIPIQDLLHRIRWDPNFGRGEFTIGYYDRVAHELRLVPLRALHFEPGDHYAFQLIDDEGVEHTIPLHRIKAVFKDGALIWHREH